MKHVRYTSESMRLQRSVQSLVFYVTMVLALLLIALSVVLGVRGYQRSRAVVDQLTGPLMQSIVTSGRPTRRALEDTIDTLRALETVSWAAAPDAFQDEVGRVRRSLEADLADPRVPIADLAPEVLVELSSLEGRVSEWTRGLMVVYRNVAIVGLVLLPLLAAAMWLQERRQTDLISQRDLEAERGYLRRAISRRERELLAMSLHDGPSQLLVRAIMDLERYGATHGVPNDLRSQIHQTRELLMTATEEVRHIIGGLRVGEVRGADMPDLLRGLAERTKRIYAVECAVVFDAPWPEGLNSEANYSLYSIVREALSNVGRHAQARQAVVQTIDGGSDSFVLEIRDDGVGVAGSRAGTGMEGMREHARMAHATIAWRTESRGGTVVEVIVPKWLAQSAEVEPALR